MPSSADTDRLKDAQATIVALATRDLEEFFASLDLDRPEQARDALVAYMPLLIQRYGSAVATLAADWYDEVRSLNRIVGRFRAVAAVPVDVTASVEATVRRSMGAAFAPATATAVAAGALPIIGAAASSTILPALTDPMTKLVLAPSRETILTSTIADPKASGWQRITRPGSCKFCRMLAGRPGAVYKERTADFAAHGHCNCAAAPSWDRYAPEVDVKQYVASERLDGVRKRAAAGDKKAAAQIERHTARVRDYLADMDD